MITYFVYFAIASILIFILYLAIKAITRGIDAKNENKKKNKDYFTKKNTQESLSTEILKLKKMYADGTITKEEFYKAKEKLLR
tara:strand:+ start:200 stop:448 length:249 start_codon:yes stop_codon:yes gene_type:complete